jgi:ABC-type transport system substrate-binding protein
VVVTAIGFSALFTGVAAPAGMAGTAVPKPLRMTVGTPGNIGSLDPRHGDSVIAREVWNIQYPTLTALDPETFRPTAGVADAWSPLPDGHGWRYSLRPGQKWSDGTPLTSADVVYSLDHARDDQWPYAIAAIAELSRLSARAVNASTVDVTCRHGTIPPGLLLHIVPAHVYSKVADINGETSRLGVGDGAWHVVSQSADSVELGVLGRPGGPPLDQIVFRTYPNADSLIAALSHRDVDVISGVPYSDVGRLEAMSKVTVDHAGDGTEYVLRFESHPNFHLNRVVSLAIDRVALVADAVNGVGTPAAITAQPGLARRELLAEPARETSIAIPTDAVGQRVGAFVRKALAAAGWHTSIADPGTGVAAGLRLERVAADRVPADAIPLLQPDLLQAFRTDNVTGFLREPSQRSLVVFGPTVDQYSSIVAAQRPPGEQLSNAAYVIGAIVLLALCGAAYWIASRFRRRFAT